MRNRIRELRTERNLSLAQLEQELGISYFTLRRYEREETEPKLDTWQKLANYFGVSVGYLQGIEEQPTTDIQNQKRWNERERSFLKALRGSYMLDGSWEDLAQTFKREWHKHELEEWSVQANARA